MPIQSQTHSSRRGEAVRDFAEASLGEENFNVVIRALQPIGEAGLTAFRKTADYTRRHPMRVAMGVLAIGMLSAYWLKSSKTIADELH